MQESLLGKSRLQTDHAKKREGKADTSARSQERAHAWPGDCFHRSGKRKLRECPRRGAMRFPVHVHPRGGTGDLGRDWDECVRTPVSIHARRPSTSHHAPLSRARLLDAHPHSAAGCPRHCICPRLSQPRPRGAFPPQAAAPASSASSALRPSRLFSALAVPTPPQILDVVSRALSAGNNPFSRSSER